jgi:hypothetical protein
VMHGREESDPVIVAGKPANEAATAAAEPRTGAEGNVGSSWASSTRPTRGGSRTMKRHSGFAPGGVCLFTLSAHAVKAAASTAGD